MSQATSKLRIGCCGFPEARGKYLRRFGAVEVQRTFYQPPRPETAERWRAEAPSGFVFAIKAWQLITHPPSSPTYRRLSKPIPSDQDKRYGFFRPTDEVREAWEVTLRIATELEADVVLFQCPASFRPTSTNLDNLRAFFESIEPAGFGLAWEPRGEWPRDLVAGLCRDLHLIHCVDPFAAASVTDDSMYYRLHGIGGYRYRYTDEDLGHLLELCRSRAGYVFFNNAGMLEDALRFQELAERG